jgi:hypothetical protein
LEKALSNAVRAVIPMATQSIAPIIAMSRPYSTLDDPRERLPHREEAAVA